MYTFSVARESKSGLPPHCLGFYIRNNYTNTAGRTLLNEGSPHRIGRYLQHTSNERNEHPYLSSIRTRDPTNKAATDLRLRRNNHRHPLLENKIYRTLKRLLALINNNILGHFPGKESERGREKSKLMVNMNCLNTYCCSVMVALNCYCCKRHI
jgi:hypothetical protein